MYFNDYTHYLRDLRYTQDWTISDVATSPTDVNCGDMEVSFEYLQGGELDPDIFDIYLDSFSNKFEILSTLDETKVREYDIIYIVSYKDYPNTSVTSQDYFEIEIVDLCDEPESISASNLVD